MFEAADTFLILPIITFVGPDCKLPVFVGVLGGMHVVAPTYAGVTVRVVPPNDFVKFSLFCKKNVSALFF